jgi:hypothetical protein
MAQCLVNNTTVANSFPKVTMIDAVVSPTRTIRFKMTTNKGGCFCFCRTDTTGLAEDLKAAKVWAQP